MPNCAALLDALIVAASDNLAVDDQYRAYRDATGRLACASFVNGRRQEGVQASEP